MAVTKKGLKMIISKCFNNYDFEKSDELTTEIRGEHKITNGYKFLDDLEKNEIILFWQNDELEIVEKLEKIKEMHRILKKHGFAEYMEIDENNAQIILRNYQ